MTDFPAINYLDAATFAETQEDNAITAAKMEGGYVLSRPRFTRRPRRTFAFVFNLVSDSHKALLQNFWASVFGSSNAFNWTHPATGEVIIVRFDPSMQNLKFEREGFGSRNIWKTNTIVLTEV